MREGHVAREESASAAGGECREDGRTIHHKFVIIGGGTGGISVAARLCKRLGPEADVAVIEPARDHFYQPAWTLVGGGAFRPEATRRDEAKVMPRRATWIQERVVAIDPEQDEVTTSDGQRVRYEYLVVAAGIRVMWDQIPGLVETLGQNGVCSNYAYDSAAYTWDCIRHLKKGNAIFTQPNTPIKCGGAPQKICYLAEDHFRREGKRGDIQVIFASATPAIFPVPKYRKTLQQHIETRGIETMFQHVLTSVDGPGHMASFENLQTRDVFELEFDMIHVTPPMGPPEFIAQSRLADEAGWVDVDGSTLRHTRYPNVFSLGDCSNLPTSKTGAAIRKQAPVLAKNLLAVSKGLEPTATYDGYTSCPLVTAYGRVVLAEFGYDNELMETFPFDQSKERRSMYWLKKYLLPVLYWQGMLKGRA